MNIIELNGNCFIDVNATHSILQEKFELPKYYGKNLDALWDCITGWIDIPVKVIWYNYKDSKLMLGKYADELRMVFEDAEKEVNGFEFEIN